LSKLSPAEIPPVSVGKTVLSDALVHRSDRFAVILRSVIVFADLINVNIEVLRGPSLDDLAWDSVISSTCPMPVSSTTLHVVLMSDDGTEASLEAWGGGGNERYLEVPYWGSLEPLQAPRSLRIEWAEGVDEEVDLPTAAIHSSAVDALPVW
jgi:hypothetical protein